MFARRFSTGNLSYTKTCHLLSLTFAGVDRTRYSCDRLLPWRDPLSPIAFHEAVIESHGSRDAGLCVRPVRSFPGTPLSYHELPAATAFTQYTIPQSHSHYPKPSPLQPFHSHTRKNSTHRTAAAAAAVAAAAAAAVYGIDLDYIGARAIRGIHMKTPVALADFLQARAVQKVVRHVLRVCSCVAESLGGGNK